MTLSELSDKNASIARIAEKALQDRSLMAGLVAGLTAKNETYRYNCSKVLDLVGQTRGDAIYPYWDDLVKLLSSDNSYHRMSAVHHLANIAGADKENKFDQLFEPYFALLDDPSLFVAMYVAQAAGKIARAKPGLEAKITRKLLDIDKTRHEPSHRELIKAGIIASFDAYFEISADKAGILDYVQRQTSSSSPKARKTAKSFLARWGKTK